MLAETLPETDDHDSRQFFTISADVGYDLMRSRFDAVFPWHVHKTLKRIGAEGFIDNGSAGYVLPTVIGDTMGVSIWYQGAKPESWVASKVKEGTSVQYFDIATVTEGFAGEIRSEHNGIIIAHPDHAEALQAQSLQRNIWNITQQEQVYPIHLYHPDAGLATRLVAKDTSGRVLGFLFGFYGVGERQWMGDPRGELSPAVWIESQVAGVTSESRGQGIGKSLKMQQLRDAEAKGIELIRWTYDPLQVKNNTFNLGHLGAVVAYHRRAYYPFRSDNDLNRVSASRFAAFWFPWAARTEQYIEGHSHHVTFESLVKDSGTEVVYPVGLDGTKFNSDAWTPQGEAILVAIPMDWTQMQHDDINFAVTWRNATDAIFEKSIGAQPGRYIVTQCIMNRRKETPFLLLRRNNPNRINAVLYGAVS